jgi:50S ribosome-binding GTPase
VSTPDPSGLVGAARGVVDAALQLYGTGPADPPTTWARAVLHDARARLDEPLRVALAGTLKAGKSTLLNALVGERIAATDAGECTRLVTWYRDAPSAAVVREDLDGRRASVPFTRDGEGLRIDLDGVGDPARVGRLLVDWPSRGLADATLVDTPGLESIRETNSRRTLSFVTPDDRPSGADAVVYLMRHAHRSDVGFLEAFADLAQGGAGGLGAVGASGTVVVLSRADEVGGGGLDAVTTAGQVAQAYREDPALRPLCQTVVAVDGLLAETARTLRQSEFTALRALARAPRAEVDALLLSADRFTAAEPPAVVAEALASDPDGVRLDEPARRGLMERFGVFGIRSATTVLRRGARTGRGVVDSPSLAEELVRRSGLGELRDVLGSRVLGRRDVHQARSALLAVDLVLGRAPRPDAGPVAAELERLLTGAHAFTEQRLLAALRQGQVTLPEGTAAEAERLLGGDGPGAAERLGLADGGSGDERAAALEALDRWRVRAESPLTSRAASEVARAVVRSCEGMVAPPREHFRGS